MQATQPFVIFCSLKWSIRFSPSCLLDAWVLFGIWFLLNKSWFRYFVNLWKIQIFSASNRIQLVGILNQFTHRTVERHFFLNSIEHFVFVDLRHFSSDINRNPDGFCIKCDAFYCWIEIHFYGLKMRLFSEMKSITFPECHNFHFFHKSD